MSTSERPITEAEYKKIRPQKLDLFRFMNLDSHPLLTTAERGYIRAVCRNVPFYQRITFDWSAKDGLYYPNGYNQMVLGEEREMISQLIHPREVTSTGGVHYLNPINMEQLVAELSNRMNSAEPNKSGRLLFRLPGSYMRGNFLRASLTGTGDCLDKALALTYLGRSYARHLGVTDIELLPFNLIKGNSLRASWQKHKRGGLFGWTETAVYTTIEPAVLGHDGYTVVWGGLGEQFLAILGAVIPCSIFESGTSGNWSKAIAEYIVKQYPGYMPSEKHLEKMTLHALSAYRVVRQQKARKIS